MTVILNKLRFIIAVAAILSVSMLHAINNKASAASVIASSPCDALYYETLSARAWLEAQREITQNQNLILKPDSVFEYTCFDRLLRELADHADEMLSETSSYGTPLGSSSMDNALRRLVGDSLVSYINLNYGSKTSGVAYNLLSGHTAGSPITHSITNVTGGSAYSCDIMSRVWHAAKCINFVTDSPFDGFYTFDEYLYNAGTTTPALDKRHLPTACAPITTSWSGNITTALTSGSWTNDPVQTYQQYLTPPTSCTGNCRCTLPGTSVVSPAIPTGVRVLKPGSGNTNYQEHICLQPGCRYHPGGQPLVAGGGTVSTAGCYGR